MDILCRRAGQDRPSRELLKAQPELVNFGQEKSEKEPTGGTPLLWAARLRQVEAAKVLLSAGAEVNAFSDFGHDTALSQALRIKDNQKMIVLLLDHGADPHAMVGNGALHYAVIDGPRKNEDIGVDGSAVMYDTSSQYELVRRYQQEHPGTASNPAATPPAPSTSSGQATAPARN